MPSLQSLKSLLPSQLFAHGRKAQALTDEDFRLLRATGTIEYLAGAFTLTGVVMLPDPDTSDHGSLLVLAAFGLLLAALRYTSPQRLDTVRASILTGLGYIGVLVFVTHPMGPTPFFFLWPMLTAGYFLGRRDLAVATAAFALTLAVGMGLNPSSTTAFDIHMFMPTFLAVTIASTLALMLRERLDGLMGDLAYTASTDVLTGLANRRTFGESFDREIERARRCGTPLALALFDLDHFKAINDRLGHAEGDKALQRFAGLLSSECRVVDVPARIGGEEFALILSNATAEGARLFSERLIEQLQTLTATDPAPLNVSVGVSEISDPTDTQDLLLLAADRALYEAKNTGRGKVVVARSSSPSRAEHTGELLELSHHAQVIPAQAPFTP